MTRPTLGLSWLLVGLVAAVEWLLRHRHRNRLAAIDRFMEWGTYPTKRRDLRSSPRRTRRHATPSHGPARD